MCACPALIPQTTKDINIKVKTEERDDIIDLTIDEDVKPIKSELMRPMGEESRPFPATLAPPDYGTLAEDESHASLRDLLECLKVEELRDVVKRMHVQKKASTVSDSRAPCIYD